MDYMIKNRLIVISTRPICILIIRIPNVIVSTSASGFLASGGAGSSVVHVGAARFAGSAALGPGHVRSALWFRFLVAERERHTGHVIVGFTDIAFLKLFLKIYLY